MQFINTSQNATSYSWSFPGGNPSTSTQTNPIVTFNTPGTYTITLTASNGNQNNTYSQLITVNQNPIININVSPSTNICYGNSVTLTATGATSYQWNNNLGTNNSITITPTSSTSYLSLIHISTHGGQRCGVSICPVDAMGLSLIHI